MTSLVFKLKAFLVSTIVCCIIFLGFAYFNWPKYQLEVYFLNIGQGDSTLIKTPEGHLVLIDGGAGTAIIDELGKILKPWQKKIDLMVLTHPHNDHTEGLVEVMKRFDVKNLMITGVERNLPSYEELLNLAMAESTIHIAEAKKDFWLGAVKFDVLFPFDSLEGQYFEEPNNSSIVIKMSYRDSDFLLTGDIEKEVEELLLEQDLRAKVLKAPHQGSKTSSSFQFLEKVQADEVVIMLGKDNSYGHPHKEVLERYEKQGMKILRTDKLGTVDYVIR